MDLYDTLELFYEISRIPMEVYKDGACIFRIPEEPFHPGFLRFICSSLFDSRHPVCYTISEAFLACGLIRSNSQDAFLLLGPLPLFSLTTESAKTLLDGLGLPYDCLASLLRWVHSLPAYDAQKFRGTLNFLDSIINNEKGRSEYLPIRQDPRPQHKKEAFVEHMGYVEEIIYESKMLSCIENGNVLELRKAVYEILHWDFLLTELPISSQRYLKNILIGANSLACRAAIKGGLGTQAALSLSDGFLANIEKCQSFDEFCLFLSQMLITYAKNVNNCQIPKNCSLLSRKVIRLVQENLYEKITPAQIADILHMDLSYLGREFKKSTGKTITLYIQEQKIAEARRQLETTNLPLSQIAMQLNFSSQNYFHHVFKKITGVTPNQYAQKQH